MGVLIAEIDKKKECITVRNMSDVTMDLTGWKLVLKINQAQFEFPRNSEVGRLSNVRVWCGKKNRNRSFDRNNLWWDTAAGALSTDGESASLENSRGFVASKSRSTPLR